MTTQETPQVSHYNVAVIGQGPAGMTASLYAARAGLSVVSFEMLGPGGQMVGTEHLDNYPGFAEGVSPFDLAFSMNGQAARFGAHVINEEVLSLDAYATPKRITTAFGTYTADAVILAMGAEPRHLGLPGEDDLTGRGVSYCATCDGGFFRGKKVVVVGGGNTAVVDAVYLSRIAEEVHLVHRRGELRADAVYAKILEGLTNLTMHMNAEVVQLHAEDARLAGVTIKDVATGQTAYQPASGLFVAVGIRPKSSLLEGLDLERDEAGYVVADESGITNISGVFVAGDLRTKALRQVVTATSDGANAATAAFEYISLKA